MNEIVKSVSIANLVQQREACVSRVSQAMVLLMEAAQIAGAGHLDFPRLVIDGRNGQRLLEKGGIEAVTREIDAGGWKYLMDESGLRSLMDHKARTEWDSKVYANDVPDLTHANIEATFTALHDARGDMFERGVINCFRGLSWDFKTNSPRLFGKRIILSYLATNYKNLGLSFNNRTCDVLDDLARVHHLLDGKPEADHRSGYYSKLNTADREPDKQIEDDYFQVRWFKKGTGHVLFKRPDIVQKMNAILAKHHPNALPCDM